MKTSKKPAIDRIKLHRETLRDLSSLRQVAGGVTAPGASCYPVVCFTTTVASSCC
ncbi:MAG TPA: hypothetical protein VMW75_04090 [Thermoanaerobaculia bacterium]|nr:hypothetical protein [Thermoanaerobaculia bacterium]